MEAMEYVVIVLEEWKGALRLPHLRRGKRNGKRRALLRLSRGGRSPRRSRVKKKGLEFGGSVRRAPFRGKTINDGAPLSGALGFDVGAMAAPGDDGLESPLLASGFTSRVDRPLDETLVRGTRPPALRPVPTPFRESRNRR
jgi:hypothetical protein